MSRTLRIGSLLRAIVLAPPFLVSDAHEVANGRGEHLYASGCRRPMAVGIARNRWTNYSGISGRFAPESVDDLNRNAWTICGGIRSWKLVCSYRLYQKVPFEATAGIMFSLKE